MVESAASAKQERGFRSMRRQGRRSVSGVVDIVRQIVEAHQGTVRVESELGQGATFWVDLPLQGPGVGSA